MSNSMLVILYATCIATIVAAKTNYCWDAYSNCTAGSVYVDETKGRDEESCDGQTRTTYRTLAHAAKCVACCNDIVIHILGNITLNTSILLHDINNVTIIGTGSNRSHITCGWEFGVFNTSSVGAGFSLEYAKNFTISDLTLKSCGTLVENEKGEILENVSIRSAITMWRCDNISIKKVQIESSNGNAITIFNTNGTITIVNSTIQSNYIWHGFDEYKNDAGKFQIHGGGGIHIHIAYICKAVFNIEDCNLNNNTKKTTGHSYEAGAEAGGGLLIYLAKKSRRVNVNVIRCNISHNTARWEGGVFIGIVKNSSYSRINVINSTIEGNYVPHNQGGGGMDIGLYEYYYKSPPRYNTIEINNTIIRQNKASYGGGVTIFSDSHHTQQSNLRNKLRFYNCTWSKNIASLGAAIDISPNAFDEVPGGVPLTPIFINCTFENNSISPHFYKNNNRYSFSSAIVSITSINTVFNGYTRFINNQGTALMVNSAIAIFDKNSNANFTNNTGEKGGAIALLGISYISFKSNSLFHFENNTAEIGGAIYSKSINEHDYILTKSCFLKYSYYKEKISAVKKRNTTFKFMNNTAKSNIGNSIFVSTLMPCNHSFASGSMAARCDRTLPQSIFSCCVADFNFTSNQQRQNEINTMSYKFNTTIEDPIKAFPGEKIYLNPVVLDETNSNINTISVLKVSTLPDSKIRIKNSPEYTTTGETIVIGDENSNGIITLQTNGYRTVTANYNVTLTQCPLGYINSNQECICKDNIFFGVHCNPQQDHRHSFITAQTWVGFSKGKDRKLLSSFCPIGYCKSVNNTFGINRLELEDFENISELICANGREGVLCSQCADGSSVCYQSTEYECCSDNNCGLGVLMYIMTELLPVTIIFIIAIIFNISFTSGALNTFVLYAQVVQLYDTNDYAYTKKLRYLLKIQRMFYGVFNLNFRLKKYCLWKGAMTLDILAIKYVTILYCFGLVICLVAILNRFTHHKLIKICHYRGNLIHGLAAFFVVCYSQCAIATFSLLRPATLWEQGPKKHNETVVYLNGNILYFGREHTKYAVPAIFFLIMLVSLPPALLFFNSIVSAVISVSTRRCCSKSSPWLTNKLLMIRLKPLLDTFQGCFRDGHRIFAGMYFLYRVLFLSLNVFSPTETKFYLYGIITLMLIIILHAIVQPYKDKWHNILDVLFFANIMILNGISLYIYMYTDYNIFSRYHLRSKSPIKSTLYIQLILLFSPIVYIASYVVYNIQKSIKASYYKDALSINSQDDCEEWPDRLLNENYDDNYEAFHES